MKTMRDYVCGIVFLILMVAILTFPKSCKAGLTSTYEATYTNTTVVLEAVIFGESPWWAPLWMSVTIVGTTSTGETETISVGCIPLSIFIWSVK